jgi:hypothetical protein
LCISEMYISLPVSLKMIVCSSLRYSLCTRSFTSGTDIRSCRETRSTTTSAQDMVSSLRKEMLTLDLDQQHNWQELPVAEKHTAHPSEYA